MTSRLKCNRCRKNPARYRVHRYKLCLSCLRWLCRKCGVKCPIIKKAKAKKANPRSRVFISAMQGGGYYILAKQGKQVVRVLAGPFRSFNEAVRSVSRFRKNPRALRLGTALELRYRREVGKHRGLYKHAFTGKSGVYYRKRANEVVVR